MGFERRAKGGGLIEIGAVAALGQIDPLEIRLVGEGANVLPQSEIDRVVFSAPEDQNGLLIGQRIGDEVVIAHMRGDGRACLDIELLDGRGD